jgi:acyl carrier protein
MELRWGNNKVMGKSLENMGFQLKLLAMDSIGLIREFLKDRLGADPETVVPEAQLVDLGVDSLMMLELMFEFEDRFDIKLSNDLKAPQTVGEMVTLMDGLRAAKG